MPGSRLTHLGIVVLTCEKVLQHVTTAAVPAFDSPSVGLPDLDRAEARVGRRWLSATSRSPSCSR